MFNQNNSGADCGINKTKESINVSWKLCTSQAAIYKAGLNANSAVKASGSILSEWSNEAEGQIVERTRRNWVSGYADVASGAKTALADACSDLIGMKIINYDLDAYPSKSTPQTMLNVLADNSSKIISDLKDFNSNEIKDPS